MQTQDIFYTQENFESFAKFFAGMNEKMIDHPLYEKNIMKIIYQMAQYDEEVHSFPRAVLNNDDTLMYYLIENTDIKESDKRDAIMATVISEFDGRFIELCDMFGTDENLLIDLLTSPSRYFIHVYREHNVVWTSLLFTELLERAFGYGKPEILLFLISEIRGSLEVWFPAAINHNNYLGTFYLIQYGAVPDYVHWKQAQDMGRFFICDLFQEIYPDIVEEYSNTSNSEDELDY